MKATYGFRATMTARPGKGDELIDLLLSATTDGSGASENCGRAHQKPPLSSDVSLLPQRRSATRLQNSDWKSSSSTRSIMPGDPLPLPEPPRVSGSTQQLSA